MICSESCPKGLNNCTPQSNVVSECGETFVCIGFHNEKNKDYPQDIFRHCFKSVTTESCYDYDEYDLLSIQSVVADTLLTNELIKRAEK